MGSYLETHLLFLVSIVMRKPGSVNGFPHFLSFPQFLPREFMQNDGAQKNS